MLGAMMAVLMFAMVGPASERGISLHPATATTKPQTKAECKNGGYKEFDFKSQGPCIKAVNATPDSPAPLASDRIVFSTTRFDGTYQLATMNPDGSDVQPITSTAGPPQEYTPAISPDRRSIAYVTDANELGVVNVDGTNSILLPPPPAGANRGFPDWTDHHLHADLP